MSRPAGDLEMAIDRRSRAPAVHYPPLRLVRFSKPSLSAGVRRFTMDEIDRYAKICRVERVMRPYLEALVG